MNQVLTLFKILALSAVTTLCIYTTLLVRKLTTVDTVAINTVTTNLNASLQKINQPKVGTIAELDKTILAVKSLTTHADMVVAHENAQLTTLDAQERTLFSNTQQVFSDMHTTLTAGQETLTGASSLFATTETTVLGVRPVLSHLDATVTDGNEVITKVNLLFTSPAVLATTKNIAKITFHAANIMDTADQVSAKATHTYLHPSTNPWARAWDSTSPYILSVLKIATSVAP